MSSKKLHLYKYNHLLQLSHNVWTLHPSGNKIRVSLGKIEKLCFKFVVSIFEWHIQIKAKKELLDLDASKLLKPLH